MLHGTSSRTASATVAVLHGASSRMAATAVAVLCGAGSRVGVSAGIAVLRGMGGWMGSAAGGRVFRVVLRRAGVLLSMIRGHGCPRVGGGNGRKAGAHTRPGVGSGARPGRFAGSSVGNDPRIFGPAHADGAQAAGSPAQHRAVHHRVVGRGRWVGTHAEIMPSRAALQTKIVPPSLIRHMPVIGQQTFRDIDDIIADQRRPGQDHHVIPIVTRIIADKEHGLRIGIGDHATVAHDLKQQRRADDIRHAAQRQVGDPACLERFGVISGHIAITLEGAGDEGGRNGIDVIVPPTVWTFKERPVMPGFPAEGDTQVLLESVCRTKQAIAQHDDRRIQITRFIIVETRPATDRHGQIAVVIEDGSIFAPRIPGE